MFLNLRILIFGIAGTCASLCGQAQKREVKNAGLRQGLIGYWELSENITDRSGNNLQVVEHAPGAIKDKEKTGKISSTGFDGRGTWLEVPAGSEIQLGNGDFSIAAWVNASDKSDDVPGDIISRYDAASRRGFHLGVKSNYGPNHTANFRQLYFGIDDNFSSAWVDNGRPGNALLAFGMADYKGDLYAATCEPGAGEYGHVYRYSSNGNKWIDCGFLDSANTVMALITFNGELYAATGHYRVRGSSLPESENIIWGGKVFRYSYPDKWVFCGQLPVEAIEGMMVFNGKLYASSLYTPGFFRYEGGEKWVKCDDPGKRVNAMAVYDGYLYATSYDWGHVYRYDGSSWTDCGQVGDEKINTQCYAFAVYEGRLYVATWASGRVYRFDGINQWADVGRLGQELEVMGLIVHNGRLLGGTLPLAEVYSYEGDTTWQRMDQLDKTPDVKYRRAWTMVEHDGKVFCSTLPSGKVYAFEAGKSVMSPDALPSGWQHIAAIKTANHLKLFINGEWVSETKIPGSMKFNVDSPSSLKIGFGPNDYFNGRIKALRLYNRALNDREIKRLAVKSE